MKYIVRTCQTVVDLIHFVFNPKNYIFPETINVVTNAQIKRNNMKIKN